MVGRPDTTSIDVLAYLGELDRRSRAALNRYVDASALTIGLLGSAVTANVFLLGVAFQAGAVPLSASAIERAIELNGAAVEANLRRVPLGPGVGGRPGCRRCRRGAGASPAELDTQGLEDLADDPMLQRWWPSAAPSSSTTRTSRRPRRYVGIVRRCREAETRRRRRRLVRADGRPPTAPPHGVQGRVRGGPPVARRAGPVSNRPSDPSSGRRGTFTRRCCGRWG